MSQLRSDLEGKRDELMGRPGQKLSDALYTSIRDEVVFGAAGSDSGERIYPRELSARFNVSPTPVREALMRLAAEGYIESIPRRGFRIRKPTPQQVRDLWNVRLGLEVNAGELAIERLVAGEGDSSDLDALEEIISRTHETWEGLSGREQIELNSEFHGRIVAMSGNALLQSIYGGIQLQYVSSRVRRGVQQWRKRRDVEVREHQAIVDGLRALDPDAYRLAVRAHVKRSLADALRDVRADDEAASK